MTAHRSARVGPRSAGDGPIFIAGADRSGKTLLRWILSSHPRVVITRRTDMWTRFYRRFGDLSRPVNFEKCLGAMLARKQIAALSPDPHRIRLDFYKGPLTYENLFAIIHRQYAERCGKPRWGDQTAFVERFADKLLAAYPGARIVHIVRDPRDCHCAQLERDPRSSVAGTTTRWLESAGLARDNRNRHPGTYMVVRYESLVATPEDVMRDVCSFLGEEFLPYMLLLEGVRRYEAERAAAGDGSPITDAYVGSFREGIDPYDLAFIQTVAAGRMAGFGYRSEPVTLSAGGKIMGALTSWPRALARMGARQVVDAMRSPREIPRFRTTAR